MSIDADPALLIGDDFFRLADGGRNRRRVAPGSCSSAASERGAESDEE
jgi:hypothetical protein